MIDTSWNAEPGASIILEISASSTGLQRTLDALAAQTADPRRFEILVVDHRIASLRADPSIPALIASFRDAHPAIAVRTIMAPMPNRGVALNLAFHAVRHEYLTFIRSGDWVSPTYLRELLLRSADRFVVQSMIADGGVAAGGAKSADVNQGIAEREGLASFWNQVPEALRTSAGKLVPTAPARRVGWNELGTLPDSSFWYALALEESGVTCRTLPAASDALYVSYPSEGDVASGLYEAVALPALHASALLATYLDRQRVDHALVRQGLAWHREKLVDFAVKHPEDQARLLRDLQILELEERFQFEELHKHGAETLVVAFRFPPVRDTSANVVARRIREWQRPVDVLSGGQGASDTLDPSTPRLVADYVLRHAVVEAPTWFADWSSWRAFAESGMAIVRDWEAARGGRYPYLYSRAMWAQSHLLAAVLKLHSPQTRWTAEFSDPLAHGVDGALREPDLPSDDLIDRLSDAAATAGWDVRPGLKLFQWLEHITFALADEITFTNENQRAFMLSQLESDALADRVRNASSVSHHPIPPSEAYEWSTSESPFDPSKVNVGYFGNFYPARGLMEVSAGLLALKPEERAALRFHVFTAKPEALQAEWDAAGLGDVVTAHPFIDYADMLKRTTELDCLLVNDAATRGNMQINPYLPSKLSDYRGSGRPIWAIVEPGSVMSSMPTAHQSVLGDTDGAIAVLRRLTQDRKSSTPSSHAPIDAEDHRNATFVDS